MKINPILSASRGFLLLEEQTANALLPMLDAFLAGREIQFEEEKPESYFGAVSVSGGLPTYFSSFDDAPAGSVAVISLEGVMMREDSCFSYGTETLAQVTKAAYEHPNIAAIVKIVRSGGGSVDGTEIYASTYGTGAKPSVTFVKGVMASAAAWVGLKGNHVMLEGKTTMVGSIGTQIELRRFKSEHVESHLIRATPSKNKNEDYLQAYKGNYEPIITHMLDPLNSVFLQEVQAARPNIDLEKYPLDGSMYVGQSAIDAGLADSFGTLDDAISLAVNLANQSENQNSNLNMKHLFKDPFKAVQALAKVEAPSEEQIDAANAALKEAGITKAALITEADFSAMQEKAEKAEQLETANASLKSEKEASDAKSAKLESDLKASQDEIARLGKQPGEKPTTPKAEGNELETEGEKTEDVDAEASHFAAIGKFINS